MKKGQKIKMIDSGGHEVLTFISYVDHKHFMINHTGNKKFKLSRWDEYFVPMRNAEFI